MGHTPRVQSKREQESNIQEYRLLRGLFLRELVELSGVSYSMINQLSTGQVSPIYETGKYRRGSPKLAALRLAEALDVDFGDLFPRYVCDIRHNNHFTADQILEFSGTKNLNTPEERYEINEFWESVRDFAKDIRVSQRTLNVMIRRAIYEETYDELAARYSLSRQRIRQIYEYGCWKFKWRTEIE